jgi:phage terminase large subunit GpA-like protein
LDLNIYTSSFYAGLKPAPLISISEWADLNRILPQESSSEPGPYRTSRTPYVREIADSLSPFDDAEQVKAMKGTQLGLTEIGNNWIGYTIDICPAPMLMVLPTSKLAERHSKKKLTPTIIQTEVLRNKVSVAKSRDSGNTILEKNFPGGSISLTGSNSSDEARSASYKNLFLDDMDGYPSDVDGQGDPATLFTNRTDSFSRRKLFKVSTPTVKDASRIEKEYEDSDQRKYHVPCPHCNEKQVLYFGDKDTIHGIKWDRTEKKHHPETAHYVCIHCEKRIEEHHKTWMLEQGEWIADNPGHKHKGYHLSSLYSPLGWVSWEKIVDEFLKATKQNDSAALKAWVNTRLAEVWEEAGTVVDHAGLYARREDYMEEVPLKACVVTAGIDVQDKRLEVEVVGWGRDEESWGIEYKIINGSPAEQSTWDTLDKFLMKAFRHESGISMHISCACIDTGGHYTKEVYDYVKPREVRRIYAIKGSSTMGAPIVGKPTKSNLGNVNLYPVGTDTAKDIFYGRLRIENEGPGYCHFPMQYDEEWFKQATSEKSFIRNGKRVWTLPIGRKNEALDIRNYALVALQILRPDWDQLSVSDLGDMVNERRVFYNHNLNNHLKEIELEKNQPIIVCCDFQKNPMVWPICQTDGKKVKVIDEITQRNSNTFRMGMEVIKKYGNHDKGIILYGSAIGSTRGRGKSDYVILAELGMRVQRVKRLNPIEQDRVNAVNMMLEDQEGNTRLEYSPKCFELRKDFEQGQWNEDGDGIDDTDFGRGNASTALSFFIEYMFPLKTKRTANRRFYK